MEKEFRYVDFQMTMKYLAFLILGVILIEVVEDFFSLNNVPSSRMSSAFENRRFETIFVVVLFAPLIEEIIFRLPLKKTKLYLMSMFFSLILLIDLNNYVGLIMIISISVFNFIIFFYQVIISKNCVTIYVASVSILVFAIIHIDNYSDVELKVKSSIEIITSILPQFLLGLTCTIVRLKSNIWYSILLHSTYNGIIIFFAII